MLAAQGPRLLTSSKELWKNHVNLSPNFLPGLVYLRKSGHSAGSKSTGSRTVSSSVSELRRAGFEK
jgi:hypothetical protein